MFLFLGGLSLSCNLHLEEWLHVDGSHNVLNYISVFGHPLFKYTWFCVWRGQYSLLILVTPVSSGRNTSAQLLLGSQFLPFLVVLAAALLGTELFALCGWGTIDWLSVHRYGYFALWYCPSKPIIHIIPRSPHFML